MEFSKTVLTSAVWPANRPTAGGSTRRVTCGSKENVAPSELHKVPIAGRGSRSLVIPLESELSWRSPGGGASIRPMTSQWSTELARFRARSARESAPRLQKGGDPAAPSGTATLLRLRPNRRSHLRRLPPLRVRPPASGVTDFHDVTGGVYKARERIHRSVADLRLLATPASRSRVADCDPN